MLMPPATLRYGAFQFLMGVYFCGYLATPASADPVSVHFSGTISIITDPSHLLNSAISVGTPFSGTYTIDPTFAVPLPIVMNGGQYYYGGPGSIGGNLGSIEATVGTVAYTNSQNVEVTDSSQGVPTLPNGTDFWSTTAPGPIDVGIGVDFIDTSGGKLTSDGFFVNRELAGWERAELFFVKIEITGSGVVSTTLALGTITSICGDGTVQPGEDCDGGPSCTSACQLDTDGDGVPDRVDNCPFYASANQTDTDGDKRGDVCECTDQNGDGRNTVADIVAINAAIFNPALATPLCDGNNDGKCNVLDIVAADTEIFSPGNTSTCARQPVPGP